MTRDKEYWAMALWVEKRHGVRGPVYIAEKIGQLAFEGDRGGVDMWREVARRYSELMTTRDAS